MLLNATIRHLQQNILIQPEKVQGKSKKEFQPGIDFLIFSGGGEVGVKRVINLKGGSKG